MKKFTSLTKFAKSFVLLAVMLASTFSAMAQEPAAAYTPAKANDWWTGEVVSNNKLAYLFNVGANIFLTESTPSETDINNASLWNIEASGKNEYKFTNAYRIHMDCLGLGVIWSTNISTTEDPTAFTLAEGTTKDRGTAYKLSKTATITKKTCYFNINGKKFTAEEKGSVNNDFLFISAEQKKTYNDYATLFNNAASYLNNDYIKKSETATKALIDALTDAAKGTYSSYATDQANLQKAIQDAKAYIKGAANGWWRGEEVADGKQVYLFNVGAGTFVTNNVASETEVDNAVLWNIKESKSWGKLYYSFTSEKDYKLYMESNWKYQWTADVTTSQDATGFSLIDGESTRVGTVYKLSNTYALVSTRYFNVDGDKYTAAENKSTANDFILISAKQKKMFDTYETLYNEAYELRFNEKIEESKEMTELLTDALNKTAKGSYASYNEDKVTLESAIKAAKDYITATGINKIENDTNAQAKVIYDLNGVRKSQLTKGINIVKMANGKVKKVLVK